MGKKKTNGQGQARVQQSMSQMVSRAALAQLGPDIEQMVRFYVKQVGNQLAVQQASTLETIFARVVVLESIVMEKLGYTTEDLTRLVANTEDEKEGLTPIDGAAELNDVTRVEVQTRTADQAEFQGSSRLKIYKTGSGQTLGAEIEAQILGMKAGEVKEFPHGEVVVQVKMDRVSRPAKEEAAPEGEPNADQAQG